MATQTRVDGPITDRSADPEAVDDPRCAHCHRAMAPSGSVGRPRRYCRRSCRQRAFEQRRRDRELTWGEDRLIELVRRYEELGDRLATVDDVVREVRRDLDDGVQIDALEVVERLDSALRAI